MGELKRPGHVADGVDVGEASSQVIIGGEGAVFPHFQTQLLDTKTPDIGGAAQRQQYLVKLDNHFAVAIKTATDELPLSVREAFSVVPQTHIHAVSTQARQYCGAGIGVLTG